MNKSIGIMITAASLLLTSCTTNRQADVETKLIGRQEVTVTNGVLTPEVLFSMGRISDAQLSPDATKVLYGVTFISLEENRGNKELFVVNVDGTNKQQITHTPFSEQNAVWINNGTEIAFLSNESGTSQLWVMNADGSNRRRMSDYPGGINGFLFSPDESKILFFSDIKQGERTADIYPDLPKATGRIVTDLMYKHWDEWVETMPHPFIAAFDAKGMSHAVVDMLEGEPYECPMKPFAGVEDFSWSPDGKQIAYACRKKTGLEYALSTNSDIYIYNVETRKTEHLTAGMMGYDNQPAFSPDGTKIAWISMERDGYESDKHRLFVADLLTGEKSYLTADFDYNADSPLWSRNGKELLVLCQKEGTTHLWSIGLDKQIRQITSGNYDYVGFDATDDTLVALRQSHQSPTELFAIDPATGDATELSFENQAIMQQLAIGTSEARRIKTTDNKEMLTWIVYPPHFDPNKKYPTLLYCQGGPQSMVSQFWSYRWNLQIMAANGYIVVAPNRRGLPGFGQEWLEQISGDYG
ncbi:prolyl oligopeptidase family serine peptidase, partial [Parabacteroides sp. OttesenSCG-928-N08]|nr:prolyl oligopeptidase family serine peptidase [Parabacteroides sp. OttesenSCG-928-N08]